MKHHFTAVNSDDILENDPYLEVIKATSFTQSRAYQDKTVNRIGRLLIDNWYTKQSCYF